MSTAELSSSKSTCVGCAESSQSRSTYPKEYDGRGDRACAQSWPRVALRNTVDSKIAAGVKKSTPFMFALTELERFCRLPSYLRLGTLTSCALGAWLQRRQGQCFVEGYPNTRMLAGCAFFALRDLANLLGMDHPCDALPEVWRVSVFGEKKHGINNWMHAQPGGMWHYEAAFWRHIIESTWKEKAEDSDCYHLAHAAWNAMMLLEMEIRGIYNPDWGESNETTV